MFHYIKNFTAAPSFNFTPLYKLQGCKRVFQYCNISVFRKSDREILQNMREHEKMDCFSFHGYSFWALPTNVYDGDTLSLVFIHEGKPVKYRCRTLGYDSPEMKPSLANPNRHNEIELAKAAKERFHTLLSAHPTKTVFAKCGKFDKYGRLLVELWNDIDTESINEIMVKEGHGKPYDGRKKISWV